MFMNVPTRDAIRQMQQAIRDAESVGNLMTVIVVHQDYLQPLLRVTGKVGHQRPLATRRG